MYETILVPVDGSGASMDALGEAFDLAGRMDSTVHVLYVVEPASYGPMGTAPDMMTDVVNAMEREGESAIEDALSWAKDEGVEADGAVESGIAHETIISYVEDHGVDLVVMGTHGRTGLDRILLGSVTEKVVRLSPVPVLTVRPSESVDD